MDVDRPVLDAMNSLRTVATLALLGVGCAGSRTGGGATGTGGSGVMPCATDEQCTPVSACMAGICVAPSAALLDMAIELQPTPERSLSAGYTEYVHVDLDRLLYLTTELVPSVELRFTGDTVPVPAGVLYTLPSSIPGRPPMVFESDLLIASDPALLRLPDKLSSPVDMSSPPTPIVAEVRLLPRPGPDQDIPPFVFQSPPGIKKNFPIPTDLYAIKGSLRDAAGKAPGAYIARAYQNGVLVSNRRQLVARPLGDGSDFVLFIPASAAGGEVSVELVPTDNTARPWYKFAAFVPNQRTQTRTVELGTATLAAYVPPTEDVEIRVFGGAAEGPRVARAMVRATLTLDRTALGATLFQLDSATNEEGIASMRLLLGTAQLSRDYDLRIFPPAGTEYASTCMTFTVTVPGSVRPVVLNKRLVRGGTLLSFRAEPVAGARVVATRLPASPMECASPVEPSTTTITGDDGKFVMYLDRGTYQLDFIPQPGSAVPRLTQHDVPVLIDDHPLVRLLDAALVHGQVLDTPTMLAGSPMPVANALVRIFDPVCASVDQCTTPPALLAETQTDADGSFRVVASIPERTP